MPSERLQQQMTAEDEALARIFELVHPKHRTAAFRDMNLLECGLKVGWQARILLEQVRTRLEDQDDLPDAWKHTLETILGAPEVPGGGT